MGDAAVAIFSGEGATLTFAPNTCCNAMLPRTTCAFRTSATTEPSSLSPSFCCRRAKLSPRFGIDTADADAESGKRPISTVWRLQLLARWLRWRDDAGLPASRSLCDEGFRGGGCVCCGFSFSCLWAAEFRIAVETCSNICSASTLDRARLPDV